MQIMSESEQDETTDIQKSENDNPYDKLFQNLSNNAETNEPSLNVQLSIPNIENLTEEQQQINSKCMFNQKERLVRVLYPGIVKNMQKALETFGGIGALETAVGDSSAKLCLNLSPDNVFAKGCYATKNNNPGILLKVKKRDYTWDDLSEEYNYEVVGTTAVNFQFTRLIDFQQFPLVAEHPETAESKTKYIYDSILPEKIPTLEWFQKAETLNMPLYFTPPVYARFDNPKNRLYTTPTERYECKERPEISQAFKNLTTTTQKPPKVIKTRAFRKTGKSVFITFHANKDVPSEPSAGAAKFLESRKTKNDFLILQKMFEDRPIWTRAGIFYHSNLGKESLKYYLPLVAYYFKSGPWRNCWIRLGYDPRKDPKSRMYQNLDFRIRTSDGSASLKILAKRSSMSKQNSMFKKNLIPCQKVTLQDQFEIKPTTELEERTCILRAGTIPPARQMSYQYCDILIPEIQSMLSRLPPVSPTEVCDFKKGWLPSSFVDQCREIVNKSVMEQVQKEVLEEKKAMQEKMVQFIKSEKPKSTDYCNQMMSNIKRGIYKTIFLPGTEKFVDFEVPSTSTAEAEAGTGFQNEMVIDLSSDEEEEDLAAARLEKLPERIEENYEDFEENEDDDENVDIDLEALQEVQDMIQKSKQTLT